MNSSAPLSSSNESGEMDGLLSNWVIWLLILGIPPLHSWV
jgi:hypothetical protein